MDIRMVVFSSSQEPHRSVCPPSHMRPGTRMCVCPCAQPRHYSAPPQRVVPGCQGHSRTVDREQQQGLIRQMERHTREQAYLLFLYSPIGLYAVHKVVEFVPHVNGLLHLGETSVTDEHWSVRQGAMQR